MKTKEKTVAVGPQTQRLKPERVQDGLAARKTLQRIKARERLAAMPGWKLDPGGRAIGKVRAFADPQHAAAYAAFAVQLAAGRRQALRLTLVQDRLIVTLHGRTGHGITGTLLALAADLG